MSNDNQHNYDSVKLYVLLLKNQQIKKVEIKHKVIKNGYKKLLDSLNNNV